MVAPANTRSCRKRRGQLANQRAISPTSLDLWHPPLLLQKLALHFHPRSKYPQEVMCGRGFRGRDEVCVCVWGGVVVPAGAQDTSTTTKYNIQYLLRYVCTLVVVRVSDHKVHDKLGRRRYIRITHARRTRSVDHTRYSYCRYPAPEGRFREAYEASFELSPGASVRTRSSRHLLRHMCCWQRAHPCLRRRQ